MDIATIIFVLFFLGYIPYYFVSERRAEVRRQARERSMAAHPAGRAR